MEVSRRYLPTLPTYPAAALPARYLVQEGKYIFSVQAQNNAGLQAQQDYPIIVDLSPPVTDVLSPAPRIGAPLPTQVGVGA